MIQLNRIYSFIIALVFLLVGLKESQGQTSLKEPLTLDPALRTGKLENGLTYYVRENKKPDQVVELRLVVNVGSIVEDDDQLGLAHMAEHMAFNGTKHFKKNEIVSFLQNIGVGFGNDLNAYTSFNETIYILPVPTDKPGNIEKGFQVLEDWAHEVTYLNEDIESERAIILEEARLGKGAQDRMFKQIYPALFAGSRYAKRLTIGSDSIIRNFKPDVIRRFYKDWYRPDLMSVIVVGDIQPDSALALVKKHFAALSNPPGERKREFEKVPAYASSEALIVTDKEATGYRVNLIYPVKAAQPVNTTGDYRALLVKQLFTSLMNQRLAELTQQANPPFVGAATGYEEFVRGYENFSAFAAVGTGDIKLGLDALIQEIERAKRYGFANSELERARKSLSTSLERAYNNRDKTESGYFVDEYVNHFLSQSPAPGIEKEFLLSMEFIPGIALEEVNAFSKWVLTDSNRLVFVTGPEVAKNAMLPLPADLLSVIDVREKAVVKPYEDKVVATNLIKTKPVAGKLVKRSENKELGTTELKLSNGITCTLKSTDFKNDQILMGATRPGGKNYYGVADRYNAEFAVPIATAMGVGEFSPTDLKKALAGKSISVTPVMTDISEGFRGNCGNRDVETMLQLLYLYVTQPRTDTTLFRSYVQRSRLQYAALVSNPQTAFIDTLFKVMYKDNPLAPIAVPKPVYFDKIDRGRTTEIFKERLGDASGMHFVFVGSFMTDSLVPLLETYLGSLPVSGKTFAPRDNGVRPVKGNNTLKVNKGKEPKSLILSFYNAEKPYNEDMALKAQAISEILNIRIIEELREKIQGIYGGGMYASAEKYPYNNYSFVLQLPCGPEKADTLLKAARKEISSLINQGPALSYLDKVKKQWLEKYRTNLKENGVWLNQLLDFKANGADPKYFLQYEKVVEKLTVKDIQLAAQQLLTGKNVFTAILMPEKGISSQPVKKAF